jgi:hypothetical protein
MGGNGRTGLSDTLCVVASFVTSAEALSRSSGGGRLREQNDDETRHGFVFVLGSLLLPASASDTTATRWGFEVRMHRGSIASRVS